MFFATWLFVWIVQEFSILSVAVCSTVTSAALFVCWPQIGFDVISRDFIVKLFNQNEEVISQEFSCQMFNKNYTGWQKKKQMLIICRYFFCNFEDKLIISKSFTSLKIILAIIWKLLLYQLLTDWYFLPIFLWKIAEKDE